MGVCVQRGALDRNVHLHDLEHWGVGVLVAAIGPRVVSRGICGMGGLEGVGGRVLCLSFRPSLCQGRASFWRLTFDLRDSVAGSTRLQRAGPDKGSCLDSDNPGA